MKKRRKRTNTKNRVMTIRVLLAPDPHFVTCMQKRGASPITQEELSLTGQDPKLVGHLRAINNFSTEQMGVDMSKAGENTVRERGFCIHKACRCCPAITMDCKSMIEWEGAAMQKIGNKNPKQRIIEIQSPVDITPEWYKQTIACPTFQQLKILTKEETIRLVSSIIAVTLPYYASPQDMAEATALGKPFTAAFVEWGGDKRWPAEYDLFILENLPESGRKINSQHQSM